MASSLQLRVSRLIVGPQQKKKKKGESESEDPTVVQSLAVIVCVLLLTANTATAWEWPSVSDVFWKGAVPVAGGVAAVVATPVVLTAAGFGAGGVVAGSVGAKLMSAAWSTGVGAGAVGGLQAVGAAGLTLLQTGVVGVLGATVTKLATGGEAAEEESCEKNGK